MTPLTVGLALFAAILHAAWNAALRSGADRLWSVTVMSFATTAVAAPLTLALPPPAAPSWPYLALSAALQVGYGVFLARAYQHGELGHVYPVVRGGVPVLVTLGGWLLAGQRPDALAVAGIALVAAGVMSLADGGRRTDASVRAMVPAFITSLFIAAYVTADGIGVRLSGHPRSYAAWIFLLYGAFMPATFVALRGRLRLAWSSPDTLKALAGGVVSLVSYAATLSALALGPLGPVSALRETSVVFVLLNGSALIAAMARRWPPSDARNRASPSSVKGRDRQVAWKSAAQA